MAKGKAKKKTITKKVNKNKKRRISAAQLAERVATVAELVCAGLTDSEVARYIRTKTTWGEVTPAEIFDEYVDRARQAIRANAEPDQTYRLGQSLSRLDDLYKKSSAIQDYKTCLAVQKEINRLLGLDEEEGPAVQSEHQPRLFFAGKRRGSAG